MKLKPKKVGEKVDILCPECDGIGLKENGPDILRETSDGAVPLKMEQCTMCNGTGKISGVVTGR